MYSLDTLVDKQRGQVVKRNTDAERVDKTSVLHTDDAASGRVDVRSTSKHAVGFARLTGVQLIAAA